MSAVNYPTTVTTHTQRWRWSGYGIALFILLLLAVGWQRLFPESIVFPEGWNLGLRAPLDAFQSWVIGNRATHPLFVYGFRPFSVVIETVLRAIESVLLWLPWPVHFILLYAIGYKAGGHRLGLLAAGGLLLMGLFGLWQASMETFALMGVAVNVTLLIGIPLGILAARSPRVETLLRPLLDAMQTLPAFVYLIPVVLFFGIARTPSVIATVIYALPPVIRLTTLGIRQVAPEAIEAADAFGSTAGQKLRKVQLPLALPSILLGINQSIMMALGIVVIAALIGAKGLGQEVLDGLQRLRVGQALEAGLAIVLMAIIFDRISYGFSRASLPGGLQRTAKAPTHLFDNVQQNVPAMLLHYVYWSSIVIVILALVFVDMDSGLLRGFPASWQLSIREPVDAAVRWLRDNLYQVGTLPIGTGPFSDFVIIYILNPVRAFFTTFLPWPCVILLFTLLGHQAGGWRLALFAGFSLFLLGWLGMWQPSMDTLSQVLVAVLLTVASGIPLGIWAARNTVVEASLRPLLDFLQTIPPFVYLVPVIMLFHVGRVPGIVASVLYALPPIIRLTNLGIRQVPAATIEAADAFGATPQQKLLKVQLPLARATILMGINQAVMMVLAMVIIAGLVGGGALGFEAVTGLARNQLGRGLEAGLAIVLLAMVLDRITQGWAQQ
ncbi:MAG: ABC transporter permease subunit [Caldilineaceae bacterium]|nr:ABC transporter permease subunit [Caldilineaceae bacterium]